MCVRGGVEEGEGRYLEWELRPESAVRVLIPVLSQRRMKLDDPKFFFQSYVCFFDWRCGSSFLLIYSSIRAPNEF